MRRLHPAIALFVMILFLSITIFSIVMSVEADTELIHAGIFPGHFTAILIFGTFTIVGFFFPALWKLTKKQ